MHKIRVKTRSREEMVDITSKIEEAVAKSAPGSGVCVVYCPHTTAAITVNEGADPDVARDIVSGLGRLIPREWSFAHAEGNSDAHLKASLVGPDQTLLVDGGRLVLGTWQRVFFCEFDGPRSRSVYVQVTDEGKGDR